MEESTPYRLIYVTTADTEQAKSIARTVVEERLAACVNILGAVSSFYWWDGKVQEDGEVSLIAKTRADLVEPLTRRIKELHTYACPCVVALPIVGGNPDFLRWIGTETG
ncbi:MAG: dihydroorotate dehydrogenase [Alphaproteobacteria bacterium RIFOXYD12_FULL_60_8]|nr:MAG: dihydroorotate dehydrogenase [Alphaproteobacteria bacterium RIFOXYD12_FULL_60_8]